MRNVIVIGMGTGAASHMSIAAIEALAAADVVFIPTKGTEKGRLASVRREIVDRFAPDGPRSIEFALPVRDAANPDYADGVHDWHDAIAQHYRAMIADMAEGETAALRVWGDPGLYDSTLRILDRIRGDIDFAVRVIPGITAVQALTAAFAMPLNTVGNPVTITTGRHLLDHGWPPDADTLVVMLDGKTAFARIAPEGVDIYWAAYVGMEEEILMSGTLAEQRDAIVAARTAARARHGWIMDIYLLRRVIA